jgi:hypothetical protein
MTQPHTHACPLCPPCCQAGCAAVHGALPAPGQAVRGGAGGEVQGAGEGPGGLGGVQTHQNPSPARVQHWKQSQGATVCVKGAVCDPYPTVASPSTEGPTQSAGVGGRGEVGSAADVRVVRWRVERGVQHQQAAAAICCRSCIPTAIACTKHHPWLCLFRVQS